MELLENRVQLLGGNADPGIPYLDAQLAAAPAAAEQDLASFGVSHCVGKQVAQHLLEQARVATDVEAARDDPPTEPFCRGMVGESRFDVIQQAADRELADFRTNDPRLELV